MKIQATIKARKFHEMNCMELQGSNQMKFNMALSALEYLKEYAYEHDGTWAIKITDGDRQLEIKQGDTPNYEDFYINQFIWDCE